jgi:hypothetical protein
MPSSNIFDAYIDFNKHQQKTLLKLGGFEEILKQMMMGNPLIEKLYLPKVGCHVPIKPAENIIKYANEIMKQHIGIKAYLSMN